MSIYEAVLKNAEPFFAWDVLSWLFIAMIVAILIVLIDLFLSKENIDSIVFCLNAAKIVIANGLKLLGIEPIEKM